MLINVTQQHIDDGTTRCATSCALALAISERFSDSVKWVRIEDNGLVTIREQGALTFKQLSRRAVQYMNKFDAGHSVEPAHFQLHDRM